MFSPVQILVFSPVLLQSNSKIHEKAKTSCSPAGITLTCVWVKLQPQLLHGRQSSALHGRIRPALVLSSGHSFLTMFFRDSLRWHGVRTKHSHTRSYSVLENLWGREMKILPVKIFTHENASSGIFLDAQHHQKGQDWHRLIWNHRTIES